MLSLQTIKEICAALGCFSFGSLAFVATYILRHRPCGHRRFLIIGATAAMLTCTFQFELGTDIHLQDRLAHALLLVLTRVVTFAFALAAVYESRRLSATFMLSEVVDIYRHENVNDAESKQLVLRHLVEDMAKRSNILLDEVALRDC